MLTKKMHVLITTFPSPSPPLLTTDIILNVLIYTKMEGKKAHINSATPPLSFKAASVGPLLQFMLILQIQLHFYLHML